MDLRNEQLKDTYGNLVTTGTTAGSPTTGGLQNGQGTLLTSVGIGTDSPSRKLSVNGVAGFGNGTIETIISFSDRGIFGTQSNHDLEIRTNGTERMRIDSGGDISFRDTSANEAFYWDASTARLGIGTTEPGTVLDIHGAGNVLHVGTGTDVAQYMSFRGSGASGAYIGYDGTGMLLQAGDGKSLRIKGGNATFNSGSTGLEIDTSGQVGIGVTPSRTLHVSSGTTNEVARFESTDTEVTLEFKDTTGTSKIKSRADFRFETGATPTEAMRIDSSGNVGIGTDNPATRLDIQGVGGATTSPSVTATTGTNYIGWKSVNTGGSFWTAIDNSTGSSFSTNTAYARVLWSNGAYPMVFSTNSTERIRIQSNGDISFYEDTGSTPKLLWNASDERLNLSGSDYQFGIQQGANQPWYHRGHSDGSYRLHLNGTGDVMTIDSSGNVGIGTDAPEKKLQVSGDAKIDTFLTVGDSGQANTYLYLLSSTSGTSNLRMGDTDTDAGAIIYSNASNFMDFRVNASERLRIDSSGNVGIGTSTPDYELQVGDGTATETINIKALNTNPSRIFFSDNDAIGQGRIHYEHGGDYMNFYTDNSERMRIDGSGNVGIGVSPSAKLHVEGGRSYFFSGDAYSVALAQTLGQGAYAYLGTNASGDFNVYDTVGNLRLTVEQGGNVGIGTDSPGARLTVAGPDGLGTLPELGTNKTAVFSNANASADGVQVYLLSGNAGSSALYFGDTDDGDVASIQYDHSSNYMAFETNDNERLRIDSDGNITQSGTSPQYIFKTASNTNFQIAVQENVSNALEITPSTTVGGTTFSNPALVVNSSGNVLVGKTSSSNAQTTVGHLFLPDGRHYATASGGVSGIFSRTSSDGDILSFYKDGTTVGSIGASGGRLYIGSDDTSIFFDSGDSPSVRPHGPVDPDGVIDIGDSGARFKDLYLSGKALIGGGNADPTFNRVNGINILSNGAILTRATGAWDLGSNVTAPTHIAFYTDNGSARVSSGNISSSGSTTSFNTSSDYRKKENVVEMAESLDKVNKLKPCEFNFIGEDTTMGGFLAHEVAEIVPNAVSGEKDAVDDEGNPIYQSIDHSKLVPLLVGAIQELRAEIEQLKNQQNELEN